MENISNSFIDVNVQKFNKSVLMDAPGYYDIDSFSGNESGRVHVIVDSCKFECYIKDHHVPRLFVFFGSAGL